MLRSNFQLQILEEYKIEQIRLKQTKQKLLLDCQLLNQKISKELQKIASFSRIISQTASIKTQIYSDSLNIKNYSSEVINLNSLSSYLNKQKDHLAKLIGSSGEIENSLKSGIQILHQLANRKKMQKYFEYLECLKFQKQIQYLQKNVIVGQSKNGNQNILFEDIPSVTLKEQSEQSQQLKLSIEQLERIVSLSNSCGGNINNNLQKQLSQLQKQSERLENIEKILDKQTKEIVKVKNFLNESGPKHIVLFINQKINQLNEFGNANKKGRNQQNSKYFINYEQLNFILNFNISASNTKLFQKPFQEVNNQLQCCKRKLKKLKL